MPAILTETTTGATSLQSYLDSGSTITPWVMEQASTIANFMISNPVALTFMILVVIGIVVSIVKRFFRI